MSLRNVTLFGVLYKLTWDWRNHQKLRVGKKIIARHQTVVQAGPFKGLKLCPSIDLPTNLPKLVGSYESELHPVLTQVIKKGFSTVVDIGTAEGYYAIGLARAMEQARVIGYEMDERQRNRCQTAAYLNGVQSRVELFGKCDALSLRNLNLKCVLLILDCEGTEVDILCGAIIPRLQSATLMVELHDAIRPGCGRLLTERFAPTHDLTFIAATPRKIDSYCVPGLNRHELALAVHEDRIGIQEWAFMCPKATSMA